MRSRWVWQVSLVLWLAGCTADGERLLVVELATDLVSGGDFVGVRVEVRRGDAVIGETSRLAPRGQSFATPQRVGLFDGLADGTYDVDTSLVDLDGVPVAARRTIVEIHEDLALTVVIAAACRGVACPGAGDDLAATTCAGGRCVDPRCSPETPERCGDVCISDATCPAVAGLPGSCVDGVCLYPRCDDGNECTDDVAVDGACVSTPNDAPCNDGMFCNGIDQCAAGSCSIHGTPPCPLERCDETAATCDIRCATDMDCPVPAFGEWSACGGFVDVCDEEGERTRTRIAFHCAGGMCASDPSTETEPCARTTAGTSCGARTCDWFGCRYPVCGTEGSEPGNCFDHTCAGGVCADIPLGDTSRPCASRGSQEGMTCAPAGSFCQGVCGGGSCGALCEHCGGVCTVVGCRTGSC